MISLRGARTHNLQNVNLDIPRNQLVLITGLSGSGKSSLAFDTLYAEGQRRYVESLSSYARQFLSMMEKPDVDHIDGLSPTISIEQKSTSHNPRSTVGTITEIYDYLRLLYARIGTPHCPDHGQALEARTVSQIVDAILAQPAGQRSMLLAPLIRGRKGEHLQVFDRLRNAGFVRVRVDGTIYELEQVPALDKKFKHDIEVVVDRFRIRPELGQRLAESVETALQHGQGLVMLEPMQGEGEKLLFSSEFACPVCGYSMSQMEPRSFSFNSPMGACPDCDGLGIQQFFDPEAVVQYPEASLAQGAIRGWGRSHPWNFQILQAVAKHYDFDLDTPFQALPAPLRELILFGSQGQPVQLVFRNDRGGVYSRQRPFEGVIPNMERRHQETHSQSAREELAKSIRTRVCPSCEGARLNRGARHVLVKGVNLPQVSTMSISEALEHFQALKLRGRARSIATKILNEVQQRLNFLVDVGLDYLSLGRSAETLSGGEAQRIRLASQIGAGLVGVLYVLDEPSIGLHQRDNKRLIQTLTHLRDLGNSVIVVEHDREAIESADHLIDFGPGAGPHGGKVVAQGSMADLMAEPNSLTGRYLSGKMEIEVPRRRHAPDPQQMLCIRKAGGNNLKQVDVDIPLRLFSCVTGVSGSGKSTLINGTLYPAVATAVNGAQHARVLPCEEILGLEQLDKCIDINQSPIGRTPRSNPATYTGLFTPIRELFAGTAEARARGYRPGRFSFNVKGGRCEACQGDGVTRVEMHFLPDIYVACDVCKGKRYNPQTLEILYKQKSIDQVLAMTVEEALDFFTNIPVLARKLQTLMDVGLSYISLGQAATTLSGGEAQRIKLSRELSKRETGNTLYILDEPTTGLHFHDVRQLIQVLHRLRDDGNTIVVIEHNLDVIKTADWIIDMGPEGGDKGGEVIATGSPEQLARVAHSHTGKFLREILAAPAKAAPKPRRARTSRPKTRTTRKPQTKTRGRAKARLSSSSTA